ncbi:hypothetical protein NDU88_000929 [Pleurodeles waltl]|uniref:Uncharacterized protein n=1 Tax=Pleurodeles waltl TaxID=8319 RepID=A0AAV7URE8_PLEWA|nr:hypothetical protein NDU88_000929 [Pleurodeles waltl]
MPSLSRSNTRSFYYTDRKEGRDCACRVRGLVALLPRRLRRPPTQRLETEELLSGPRNWWVRRPWRVQHLKLDQKSRGADQARDPSQGGCRTSLIQSAITC